MTRRRQRPSPPPTLYGIRLLFFNEHYERYIAAGSRHSKKKKKNFCITF